MDPSTLQHHHQEIMASESLDSMLVCTKATQGQGQGQGQEKKPRPPDEVLKCPRCDSTNTKFCYYNNYSLSQPRYFCKSCRRYWTKGGTLRNVPVGGGCRKNRRSSSSSSSSSSRRSTPDHLHQPHHHHLMMTSVPSSSIPSSSSPSSPNSALLLSPYDHHHHHHHHNHNQNHPLSTNDLSLAFARLQKQVGGYDNLENHGNISLLGNPSGNSHFDLFGSSLLDPQSNGLQHLYYGGNNVNVNANTHDDHHQNYQNHHQMGLQFDHNHNHNHNHNQNNQEMMSNPSSGSSTPTTIKQELGENRVLWGLPWQLSNGEANYMNNGAVNVIGGGNINEIDSLKESWSNTGVLNPTWHSLLNSPLM